MPIVAIAQPDGAQQESCTPKLCVSDRDPMLPIEIISPANHVRKRPEIYWNGNSSPGFADVNAAIEDQLRDDGCRQVEICSKDGWQLVCCELDWAKTISMQLGSVGRLFESAVVIPGPPAGGLRVEWLVAVLATAVRVWVDGQIAYSQGTEAAFDEVTVAELRGRVCIAYRLVDQKEASAIP